MKNCNLVYIGKKSKLLNSIITNLPKGELISFEEILKINKLNDFKKSILVIFSIPEKEKEKQYFNFISEIECQLIINISSTEIYASNYFRNHLLTPYYLKIKQKTHEIILQREKSVNLIVGSTKRNNQFPLIPYTSKKKLTNELSRLILSKHNNSKEIFCFNIIDTKTNLLKLLPFYIRFKLKNLSPYLLFIIDFFYKVFKFKARQYNCLSNAHFVKTLRIGDGAFGVAGASRNDIIIRSPKKNKKVGGVFLDTLVGFNKIGLDKLRHGVKTYISNGLIEKKWKFSLRLRGFNRSLFPYHVENIKWLNERDCFLVECFYKNKKYTIFAKKIKLAAGTIENIRLLLQLSFNVSIENIRISDHFHGSIGSISFDEAIKKGFIKNRFANILFQRLNLIPIYDDSDVIGFAEFRIPSKGKNKLIKLINKIKAYFFNRLGYMLLKNNTLEVNYQFLTEDSIGLKFSKNCKEELDFVDVDNSLNFKRNNIINLAKVQLSNQFESFNFRTNQFSPSNHLWGGQILLEDIQIKELLQKKKIFICGSPSKRKLGPFHHTLEVAKQIKNNKTKRYFD